MGSRNVYIEILVSPLASSSTGKFCFSFQIREITHCYPLSVDVLYFFWLDTIDNGPDRQDVDS